MSSLDNYFREYRERRRLKMYWHSFFESKGKHPLSSYII